MVSKIAKKIMSKNKSFLILELGVAQLLFSQTCSTKFLYVLTKTNRRLWQPTRKQHRESVSDAAATTLSSYSQDIYGVVGELKIMHKE
jgi:isoaspartyl peptidase/L-asparaginase-like protein (Ntn-hydrolase superfamily)